jgi:hypothetical protein
MEGGTLVAIQRHTPGQNTYETLDPTTGQVIGTYEGEKDRGFFGGLVSHAGSIGKDVAPLALAALGVNALGAGLGQASIFGPGGGIGGGIGGAGGAEFADMAAGLTPEFGTTAAYNAALPAGGGIGGATAGAVDYSLATAPNAGGGLVPASAAVTNPYSLAGSSLYGTGEGLAVGTSPFVGTGAGLALAPNAASVLSLGDPTSFVNTATVLPPGGTPPGGTPPGGTPPGGTPPGGTPPGGTPPGGTPPGGTPAVATTPTGTPPGVTPPGGATTDPFAYLLPAIGSLIGGYTQGQSAKEAAQATAAASTRAAELQREAQREALALQTRMYDEAVLRQKPFYDAGTNALAQMVNRTGSMPAAFQYSGAIPGYGAPPPAKMPALPDNWQTFSPQAKINWFNANAVTPAMLAQAGVPQTDVDWMLKNGYRGAEFSTAAANAAAAAAGGGGASWYAGSQPEAFKYTGAQPEAFKYTGTQPATFQFRAEDLQADPGYGFRLSEGLKALERSAAARGGLLSGGTGKALTRYGQDMASQEFGNAFNRSLTQYNAAVQREQQEYGRALTGYDVGRQREQEGYARALTGYDIGRQREQETYGRSLTGLQLNRAAEAEQYNRAITNYNALRQREADEYNRLAGLAGYGGTSAQQLTAAGQNYGSQAGNLMANTATNLSNLAMQQGQTAGNALLAQGAAYGRAFGDLGYLGGQYLGYPRP